MNRIPKTISLFLTFMKIGLFTFGGGYAMIPLIHRETVDNKKWISDEDILEIVAIAESRSYRYQRGDLYRLSRQWILGRVRGNDRRGTAVPCDYYRNFLYSC